MSSRVDFRKYDAHGIPYHAEALHLALRHWVYEARRARAGAASSKRNSPEWHAWQDQAAFALKGSRACAAEIKKLRGKSPRGW
jgi:hypothetical protein